MDWFTGIWNGVTEPVSDGLGFLSSTTDTAQNVITGVQDISSAVKETTLNAYETANAEKTIAGERSAGIVKTALLVGGGAIFLLLLIKVIK